MNVDTITKSERLARIERALLAVRIHQRNNWLIIKDIARDNGVSPRTIRRDLIAIELSWGTFLQQKRGVVRLDPTSPIPVLPVHLTLPQAAALALAARMLVRWSDEPNPAIAGALEQLSEALPPTLANHVKASIKQLDLPPNPNFLATFDVVTTAWAERRQIRISYQAKDSSVPRSYICEPYYIEPSPTGYAFYVIARVGEHKEVSVLKLERIQQAELMDTEFSIMPGFDVLAYLTSAWAVMGPDLDQQLIEVQLRFTARVEARVKESRWHPSQKVENITGGGCIVTFQIAKTLEMIPWLRGWGCDVEVIAPPELRQDIADDADRTDQMYKAISPKTD